MSIYRFAFFCAVAGASPAFAAPFNIESTGGVFSYTANVTHRLGAGQNLVTQTTGTTNAGTQAGVPANITDFSRNTWQMGGNFDSTKLNTTVTELDKIYDLNKIHTQYLDYLPQTYNLRTSIDGVNWSALVTGGTPTSLKFDTFTTRQVKYIEWQMVGPGADLGGVFYAYQTELQAFVDAASTDIPQREGGYNILPAGTIFATSGTSLTEVYDEDFRNFAIPGLGGGSRTLDLGSVIEIGTLKVNFYPGQQWTTGSIDFSVDGVNFTPILSIAGIGDTTFTVPLAVRFARYYRISGTGNGALVEVGAFALIPEPSTLALIPLGLLLARRSRR